MLNPQEKKEPEEIKLESRKEQLHPYETNFGPQAIQFDPRKIIFLTHEKKNSTHEEANLQRHAPPPFSLSYLCNKISL